MTWVLTAIVIVALAAWILVLRNRLLVVTVHGVSMEPTYVSGDRLLVRRARLNRVRAGQVVVVRVDGAAPDDPTGGRMVKRAVAVPGDPVPPRIPVPGPRVPVDSLLVLGDNPARSNDSRRLGYLPADALIGVVLRPIGRR
ncbi:S26 family signal peptidase [Lentzea sp. BCCO 10_0856]|uniref:S26 family signal peptidase n=1 Tax=Lentzea miocenica TaxID=3095431 RepID=A0ABU4T195_9PSEU|nr:S26 family signal peptidase [Lentzea sp. BCCO 10_0856]MDX8031926.1 S26 family signal peptidase [Lentzea sp. BCCO 10_0856]